MEPVRLRLPQSVIGHEKEDWGAGRPAERESGASGTNTCRAAPHPCVICSGRGPLFGGRGGQRLLRNGRRGPFESRQWGALHPPITTAGGPLPTTNACCYGKVLTPLFLVLAA